MKKVKLLSMKFSILVCPTTICIITITITITRKNESMMVIYLRFINFDSMVFSLNN